MMRTVQQQNARIDWISNLSSGRTPPRARSVLTREAVRCRRSGLLRCPTAQPGPVAASYPVPPTRRDAVAPLHSQIRIGHDRHLQTAPIGLLFSLGRLITLLGLAETESSLSYCQLPADQPATEARSAKPGTESVWCRPHKTTMPPSCDSAQKRNHRPRRGPVSGALSG
jgi:hypothetical protein